MGNKPRLTKGKAIAIILVILMLVTLTALTARERLRLTFLEKAVITVIAPMQNLVSRTAGRVTSVVDTFRHYRELEEENRSLKEELSRLEILHPQLKELRQENYRLRELLQFKAKTDYQLLPAEVIARNPNQWFEILTVDKGSTHGVKQGMPVVTSPGLVGSIYTVAPYSSQVMLLTDPRRGVSALVQRSRDPGIVGTVEGLGGNEGHLIMRNLPPEANIQLGDTIISSGLGPLFPKGLVLGYVLEVGDDEYGLLRYALLEPAANFNRLEELFIVIEWFEEEEEEGEEEEEPTLEEEGEG